MRRQELQRRLVERCRALHVDHARTSPEPTSSQYSGDVRTAHGNRTAYSSVSQVRSAQRRSAPIQPIPSRLVATPRLPASSSPLQRPQRGRLPSRRMPPGNTGRTMR